MTPLDLLNISLDMTYKAMTKEEYREYHERPYDAEDWVDKVMDEYPEYEDEEEEE